MTLITENVSDKTVTITENLKVTGKINNGDKWYEVMPAGAIIIWYGSAANKPKGWAICDGTNNTPNLIGKLILGANGDNPSENEKLPENKKTGGNIAMIRKKNISGSGLDMNKAEYISEIDYPPYMALHYIMKIN